MRERQFVVERRGEQKSRPRSADEIEAGSPHGLHKSETQATMIITHDDGTVEFAYFRPGASHIALAGDFNQWNIQTHAMERDDRGWWRLELELPDGEYRFKYVVDGHIWEADFAAYGVEMTEMGGWTSVLCVNSAAPARLRRAA
jgi:1,4-alpha-glucan branching enzyme